jgi:hypothetical protein
MLRPSPTALPIAYVVLRILIVLNWVYGAIVLAILVGLFAAEQWTMTALGLPPSAQSGLLIMGMRAIPALGLAAVPLNLAVLKRFVAMVETVRAGDPFVAANADRLQAVGWLLLAQQLLSVVIGLIAKAVSTLAHPLHLSAGFSPGGLGLAVGGVVQVTAADLADGNETYSFVLQESSDNVTFSAASAAVSTGAAGTYPVRGRVTKRFVRLALTVGGTTPSVTFKAWLNPLP